ncbi:MAG: hypothetical protein GX090_07035 [Firmicutes bacterium]|nr:hypothetical protein [Bacillota bacterium]
MKTLIAYVSKHSCTAKCARLLAQSLRNPATLADLARDNPDLAEYEGIILGAPLYAGSIPSRAKAFCRHNLARLKEKKLGLFICCGLEDQAQAQLESAFPPELTRHASARASFGGAIDLERQNFLVRTLLRKLMKITESYEAIDRQSIQDFARQWEQV